MDNLNIGDEQECFLPKPLVCIVASYLSTYEAAKLCQVSQYMNACMQTHYMLKYREFVDLHFSGRNPAIDLQNTNTQFPNHNPKEDWMVKFAKLRSRKAFMIPSTIKLNPHEP